MRPEFKVNRSGQLIGWANEEIEGFTVEWHDEDYFIELIEVENFKEAVKLISH